MPKSLDVIVTFEQKKYTWDGRRWYSTEDYMLPPYGMIHKLNQLLPKKVEKVEKVKTGKA